jgi:endo-1,4-beta-mannosidase
MPLHRVSFRSIWHINNSKNLNPIFQNSDNWALRGLYWLSKDIYEKEFDFDKNMEPDAMELSIIRNHLEHKCLKILGSKELYEMLYNTSDDISYTIERTEFEAKTLKLLKLVRASIIYLSIAIDHEEKKKDNEELKTLPMQLTEIAKHEKI